MYLSKLTIEGFRIFGSRFEMPLTNGLNVLVGENDSGKTAIIDAIRLALGTTSQEYLRVEDSDFHYGAGTRHAEFNIQCRFEDIDKETGGALLEHLTYEDKIYLYVTFRATRNEALAPRRRISVTVRSGLAGNGPALDGNARGLLQATYLRPLRDAERELDAGRNSRLSQILQHTKEILEHKDEAFDPDAFVTALQGGQPATLPRSVSNVSRLTDHLLQKNKGVAEAKTRLEENYLAQLNLGNDALRSRVAVANAATPEQRLRSILEKLELRLTTLADAEGQVPHGLGYNNLLFMACELLLLGQDQDTLPLLLIEEPEAHLHPQLQMRLVEFLQQQAAAEDNRQVQVIVTTHSPNLASKVKLANMTLVCQGNAFPMGPAHTLLSPQDYQFLERFLDSTKANLFFARSVLIVEGDAENLLMPTIARLLGRDFTRHGVSIVNVGTRGLRRYARIFRRRPLSAGTPTPSIPIRVACLADRDIKPTCAMEVFKEAATEAGKAPRFECDFSDEAARFEWTRNRCSDDGENVKTSVANYWTLEYDLARSGLGQRLSVAIALAKEEQLADRRSVNTDADVTIIKETAEIAWHCLLENYDSRSDREDLLSCKVYEPLYRKEASKPMVAQYLASLLERLYENTPSGVRRPLTNLVPQYIKDAVDYLTYTPTEPGPEEGAAATARAEPKP